MTDQKKQFKYQPLESRRDTIRLVSVDTDRTTGPLVCYLVHSPLSKLQKSPAGDRYDAVSYEWASSLDKKSIILNGKPFVVQRNLFEFLTAWRKIHKGQRTPWLWIDAISLNQDDTIEKSRQVQRMGEIFRSADEVIAWLGYGSNTVENALKRIDIGPLSSVKVACSDGMLSAYHLISRLSYWQRLWIVQELVLANKAKLMYKSTQIDWERFGKGLAVYCGERGVDIEEEEAVLTALGAENQDNMNFLFRDVDDYKSQRSIAPTMRKRRKVFQIYGHWKLWKPMRMPALVDLLFSFEDSKCLHWQDRVNGLLGLVQGGENFRVDYAESPAELKKRVMESFAQTEDAMRDGARPIDDTTTVGQRRLNVALDRIVRQ